MVITTRLTSHNAHDCPYQALPEFPPDEAKHRQS